VSKTTKGFGVHLLALILPLPPAVEGPVHAVTMG
jgi:hypothetical protein